MTKKQSSVWYIAATHYLTGVLVPKIIGTFILIPVFILLNSILNIKGSLVGEIEEGVIIILVAFFGAWYGSRYVNSHYIIKNAARVVEIAMVYCLAINVVVWHILYVITDVMKHNETNYFDFGKSFIYGLLISAIFYFGSKKYIKNDVDSGNVV